MIHVEQWAFVIPPGDREEFDRLPATVRTEVDILLGVFRLAARAKKRPRVFAVQATALVPAYGRGFAAKSLLRKWYAYRASGGDWRVLVNRARVPVRRGQPAAFREFVQGWFVRNKRVSRQQWLKLRRFWEQGCDDKGRPFIVPGYGTWQDWWSAEHPGEPLPPRCPGLPRGLSYASLMRTRLGRAAEKMAREGENAARSHTPHVLGTRAGLRFLEEVTFDDVKTDFRVIDSDTGEICDLWLLVAFDRATAMCLGYGMRPARARDDGTQEHLKLIDMKQIAGWVLERWGLPPYPITWKLENGCATFPEATALALRDLSGGAISVSYARMLGGQSPAGYRERALGNSRAKASHEAHNNLLHNMAGDLPGQTGRRWDVRPADLASREKEAREIHALAARLNPEYRAQARFPVLTLNQAREELNRIFDEMNARTDHRLEGFAEIAEWRPSVFAPWQPVATCPPEPPAGYETRVRNESPVERMRRLVAGLEWRRVPRSTLVHFYEHTQKIVRVDERGEISFAHEKRDHVFMNPEPDSPHARPGAKFIAYFHPLEPDYVHLTLPPPHSGYVATWKRRERVRSGDAAALQDALRYTEAARLRVREHLHRVSSERADTDAMRAHNARLAAEHEANAAAIEVSDMHTIAPAPAAERGAGAAEQSSTGAALDAAQDAIRSARAQARREAREQENLAALASAAFAKNKLTNQPEEHDQHD